MLKSRVLTGAFVVGAVAITSMFAAAPASAATLPAGQKITVLDYFEGGTDFYDASPADAAVTAFGTEQMWEFTDISGMDVDDNGHGYAIANFTGDSGPGSALLSLDANTGVLSDAKQIYLNFGDVQIEADSCQAIDYSDGIIMAICYEDVDESDVQYWGIIDPNAATGEAWLTPLYQFDNSEFVAFSAMAIDPVSGLVYAVGQPDGSALYTLSEDAGATLVTPIDRQVFGFDFDSSGQAWVTTLVTVIVIGGGDFTASALATLDLADGSNPFIEPMVEGGVNYFQDPFIQPITVWGPPALPATGPADASLPLVGGALLLLTGLILAGVTVVRRRTSEA